MLVEVAQRYAGSEVILDEFSGRVRQQDLTAVSCAHHTRCTIHRQPDVTIPPDHRFAGVHSHPHSKLGPLRPRMSCEPSLTFDGRLNRVFRTAECDEKGIALRVDLLTVRLGERGAQDRLVGVENVTIRFPKLLQEPC